MISRTIYPRRRGRRVLLGLAAAGMTVALLGIVGVALAVHDEVFQLDGDTKASTTTSIGGTQTVDWDSLFDAAGAEKTLPSDFTASGFERDFLTNANGSFNTNDGSTFATGSKDTLPITPGWQCNFDSNVNSKIDIVNAYAAAYTDPGSGDQLLYFALERNANTGDANVGFWFLQDDVSCVSASGSQAFTGDHMDGDLLIVSAFTNGGTVSTIDVYRWNDDGVTAGLGTTPVAHGVDCRSNTTPLGDAACAVANTAAISGIPWLTAAKTTGVGHSLPTAQFFEGGLNLTAKGLGNRCFNTFIADTRSSQSLTATLFDFARGVIGECASSTSTQAKQGDGTTNMPATTPIPATGTLSVKDTATIHVDGVNAFDGSVSFYLCGPSATSISTCATADGLKIGDDKAITANGTVTSDAAALTSAGYYCWHAVFTENSNIGVPGSEDTGANECFQVTPLQPVLSTQATTGPVDFGSSITDTVSLTGTANKPGASPTINVTRGGAAGGTIDVTVYGPDSCSTVAHTASLTVSGDNTAYGGAGSDLEFTPDAPGEYVFVASYSGDSPNTLGVTATACISQPDAEKVTVRQIPTEISTAPSYFPQDSATITSSLTGDDLPADGTVTFTLYGPAEGDSGLENCLAAGATGLVYGPEAVLTGPAAHSVTVGTDNTTFRVSDSETYYWLVTYAPGDTAHTGRQSNCVENISATLTGDAGPGTLFP